MESGCEMENEIKAVVMTDVPPLQAPDVRELIAALKKALNATSYGRNAAAFDDLAHLIGVESQDRFNRIVGGKNGKP